MSAMRPSLSVETGSQTPPSLEYGANPFFSRTLMRRTSSLCSAASSDDEGWREPSFTKEERDILKSTIETALDSQNSFSPFANGTLPSNLASSMARSIAGVGKSRKDNWNHSLKATRKELLSLVKSRLQDENDDQTTPRQGDSKHVRQSSMQRKGSMDFLPITRNVTSIARLSSKFHAPPPVTHPYTRRLERNNSAISLSSIAGSPSQPSKIKNKMTRVGSTGGRDRDSQLSFGNSLESLNGSSSTDYSSDFSTASSANSSMTSSSSFLTTPKRLSGGLESPFESSFSSKLTYPSPPTSHSKTLNSSMPSSPKKFNSRLELPVSNFYLETGFESDTSIHSYNSTPAVSPAPSSFGSDTEEGGFTESNRNMSTMSFTHSPIGLEELNLKEQEQTRDAGYFSSWTGLAQ